MRTLWVLPLGAALTFALAGWIVLCSVFRRPRSETQCEGIGRFWSRSIMRLAGVRVRVEGAEKVDWEEAHIVVANHQSWFDVWALAGYLPASTRFVAKRELAGIPVFGPAWQACGHISVDRADRGNAIRSLDIAGRRVKEDRLAVILFPEGTRSPDGRLRAFKKGAFVLAIQTGVPVVPVAIVGSRNVMPKGAFRIRSGEIRVRVGEPIPIEGLEMKDRDALLGRARQAVEELLAVDRNPEDEREGG